jgi:hypothetical protein
MKVILSYLMKVILSYLMKVILSYLMKIILSVSDEGYSETQNNLHQVCSK